MSGRIPQHFIDELVARADIVELIGSRVPLKKQGKEYKACCPFHGEKTPSFTVVPDKQFYHCFGCGAHGTALGFLMDHDHLSFVEAVEDLAARVGLDVPREDQRGARAPRRPMACSPRSRGPPSSIARELMASERRAGLLQVARTDRRDRRRDSASAMRRTRGISCCERSAAVEADRLTLLQVGLIIERERKPGANASSRVTTIAFAIA